MHTMGNTRQVVLRLLADKNPAPSSMAAAASSGWFDAIEAQKSLTASTVLEWCVPSAHDEIRYVQQHVLMTGDRWQHNWLVVGYYWVLALDIVSLSLAQPSELLTYNNLLLIWHERNERERDYGMIQFNCHKCMAVWVSYSCTKKLLSWTAVPISPSCFVAYSSHMKSSLAWRVAS